MCWRGIGGCSAQSAPTLVPVPIENTHVFEQVVQRCPRPGVPGMFGQLRRHRSSRRLQIHRRRTLAVGVTNGAFELGVDSVGYVAVWDDDEGTTVTVTFGSSVTDPVLVMGNLDEGTVTLDFALPTLTVLPDTL